MVSAADDRDIKNDPASAGAVSRDPASDAIDDQDITRTRHGGAQAWRFRASQASNVQDEKAQAGDAGADDERAELRELEHLAEWNAQHVMIGGVDMTNAEAQEARRWMVDHDDDCAREAVRRGYIREEDKDDYRRGLRRDLELSEKEGRGTLTEDERAEHEDWKQSKAGKAAEKFIAKRVEERRAELSGQTMKTDTLFPSAPDVGSEFASKASPNQPQQAPAPLASPDKPKPSGLTI